jgi:hypothetical protein
MRPRIGSVSVDRASGVANNGSLAIEDEYLAPDRNEAPNNEATSPPRSFMST